MRHSEKKKEDTIREILDSDSNSSGSGRRVKNTIQTLKSGDYYKGPVKILRKVKPGPLILSISDGTGNIDAIARDRIFQHSKSKSYDKNTKTYSVGNIQIKDSRKKKNKKKKKDLNRKLQIDEIEVDDVVKIFGKAKMHRNELEIKIKSIRKSQVSFDELLLERSKPKREDFSIESERYNSMKNRFSQIAQRIRMAIIEEQPILLRHHNDADGICAGLAVEEAIENVMDRKDLSPKNRIYRKPNLSPFYDEIDLFRDISKFNKYTEHFGDKSPLIVLLDTGSTPENKFALKVLNTFDFECIVVDHHNPGEIKDGKSVICEYLSNHLNPYLFGWDSQTCGGMLCYELARFIDETYELPPLPAVAALADRCDIDEVDRYVENSGLKRERLIDMGRVFDYMAHKLKFREGVGLYSRVFTNSELVDLVSIKVDSLFQKTLEGILPSISSNSFDSLTYTEINLDEFTRRGQYPTAGKVLGLLHDHIAEEHQEMKTFSIGYFSDGIIIRATHSILPVPDLLEMLQEKYPEACVEGGGHEQAGSLKYLPAFDEKIRQFVQDELKKRVLN